MLRKKQAELEKQQQLSQEIEQKLAAANNRLKETEERYAALKKQEEFLQCMMRYKGDEPNFRKVIQNSCHK